MKKRLLFVINSLGLGGAEKSLTSLLNTIDHDRYEVDLLTFRKGGMFLKLVPKWVTVLPQPAFIQSNASVLRQLLCPRFFAARMKASIGLRLNAKTRLLHDAQCYWKYTHQAFDKLGQHYDAAIAWGQGNPTHYVAEKISANEKIAVINTDYEGAGHNAEFDLPFYARYDHIVAVSDVLCELTRSVFPAFSDRISTLYDINNAGLIQAMANTGDPFNDNKRRFIKIVSVGRLVYQKGYDLAVEAAKALAAKGMPFKWYFVGEGNERARLEQMINRYGLRDRVILAGAMDNPYPYMKNADIYVQTSRFEGYCLTLAEARILNTPVISTNFDVVHNQLRDGENGLIVDMDGDAIAEAIIRLANHKELYNHIVNNLSREKKGNTEEIEKFYCLLEG